MKKIQKDNRMIKRIIFGILVIFLMNGGLIKVAEAAKLVDGIAAIVGSDIILISDVRAREEALRSRFRSKQQMSRQEILEEFIEERLLRQELNRLGITATPEEMDQAILSVLAQNRMTLPELKKELAAKGISWETYRRDLEERIRIMKFMSRNINSKIKVTEDDYELYRRRYPQKSKQQSEEEIKQEVLEMKSRDYLKSYIRGVRERTYVEIK